MRNIYRSKAQQHLPNQILYPPKEISADAILGLSVKFSNNSAANFPSNFIFLFNE